MESKKLLAVVRYASIALLILGIALNNSSSIGFYAVLLAILFLINNQIRYFMFSDNRLIVTISIFIECTIAYFLYTYYGGFFFFYYITAVLDAAALLKGIISYAVEALILTVMVFTIKNLGLAELVASTSAIIILAVLMTYIREEHDQKLKAQQLYDKLRISEDMLKKANSDLEVYANSIEELTLLRERNRISRDLHDSVGHSLSTIIIQLGAIEKIADQDGKSAAQLANNLREFVKESLQEVRTAVRELKPSEYEKYEGILAIEEMIRNFSKLTGVDVKLGFTSDKWPLKTEQSYVIYRVVQEFLSNAVRHGKATKVNMFMSFNRDELIITLQDNGIGADEISKGMGLISIWERVSELGGTAEYESRRDKGFMLRIVLPKTYKRIEI